MTEISRSTAKTKQALSLEGQHKIRTPVVYGSDANGNLAKTEGAFFSMGEETKD